MGSIDPWKRLEIDSHAIHTAVLADPRRQILAAQTGARLAGSIMFRATDANTIMYTRQMGPVLAQFWRKPWPCGPGDLPPGGYVNALAVFTGWQGKGIGKVLLRAAEEIIFSESPRLYLSTSKSNTGAIKFYAGLGYHAVGEIPNCLRPGNTEILYLKEKS
jgi:ribosomal protein S18 acetylase RimI-like enzyme